MSVRRELYVRGMPTRTTPEQLAEQSVPPSNLSLLGLIRHLSGVEAWFHFYAGEPDHMVFWNYVSRRH